MAAVVATTGNPVLVGTERRTRGTITFDSSYPTGGEAIVVADLGLTQLSELRLFPSTTGYTPLWDRSVTAPKVLAFYGDFNNAADGPNIEVPNTTNLATAVFPFEAIGY